jgi:hypothetical protein
LGEGNNSERREYIWTKRKFWTKGINLDKGRKSGRREIWMKGINLNDDNKSGRRE